LFLFGGGWQWRGGQMDRLRSARFALRAVLKTPNPFANSYNELVALNEACHCHPLGF
jgi:hypothetical protein